ncbi:MAG: ribonucleoside-diphosphate reductase beta chain [Natronomonas sp.]|jgi:ribonucleoside-diphosphate reductase beta chain|uniref:ribonucleotide-diphosphate reductase subunit beta n=1 Tax=Natronomonas sp. TaxID=2184060 RepID=UPI003988D852
MALDYKNQGPAFEWYQKSKERGMWDPESFDLEQDRRDWEEKFTDEERHQFVKLCSLFYEGEESVTKTLAPYAMAVGSLEDVGFNTLEEEMFLAGQTWEEAKHVDFFSRYFDEVFGTQDTYHGDFDGETFWNDELEQFLIHDLEDVSMRISRVVHENAGQEQIRHTLAEGVMHYMGLVEAELARVGYEGLHEMLGKKDALPGFQEGMSKIEEDEGRHIANGRWLMGKLAEEDPQVVSEAYEPMLSRFFDDVLGPTVMNIVTPNPLDIDAETLFEKAQGNYQSTIDAIGSKEFEATVGAAGD